MYPSIQQTYYISKMADNIYQKDEQTFGEKVTFYKNVFFDQDIEISGNLKVGGTSGLKADALKGG